MKSALILLAFIYGALGEQVTLFGSRSLSPYKDYKAFVSASNLRINSRVKIILDDGSKRKIQKTLVDEESFGANVVFRDISAQIDQKLTLLLGNSSMCTKSEIYLSTNPDREYMALIQLDKPIYRPGDTVKFLVVVLDRDLKPYNFNKLGVSIFDNIDAFRGSFFEDGLSKNFPENSFYKNEFNVGLNEDEGSWKIKVKVNDDKVLTKKAFSVQKEDKSWLQIFIEGPDVVSIDELGIRLNILVIRNNYDFVQKTVKVTAVVCVKTCVIRPSKILNVDALNNELIFSFQDDLNIHYITQSVRVKFIVEAKDRNHGTPMKVNKHVIVHSGRKYYLKLEKQPHFIPGELYQIKARILQARTDIPIVNQFSEIFMRKHFSDEGVQIVVRGEVHDGVADFVLNPGENTKFINLEFEFADYKTQELITAVGTNKTLHVYLAESPIARDIFKIKVECTDNVNKLYVLGINHNGVIYAKTLSDAIGKKSYHLEESVKDNMRPQSTFIVYYHSDEKLIFNTLKVEFQSKFGNKLTVQPLNVIDPGQKTSIKIETIPGSLVSLLAVDKRLSFIEREYDISLKSLKYKEKSLLNHNNMNNLMENLNGYVLTPTEPCNGNDLKLFSDEERTVAKHGSSLLDYETDYDNETIEEESVPEAMGEVEIDADYELSRQIRKFFPDVWIFEQFIATSDVTTLTKYLPDTITTWKLSSFSLHPTHGMVIGDPVDISVQKKIFLSTKIPSTMMVGEVAILHFTVTNLSGLTGSPKVTLLPNATYFQFVDFCGKSSSVRDNEGKFVIKMIKAGKVTFKINVKFGVTVVDEIQREVLVVPDGIVKTVSTSKLIDLRNQELHQSIIAIDISEDSELLSVHASLSGNLLGPTLDNFDEPATGLEQKLFNFARALIVHKYLKGTNQLKDYSYRIVKVLREGYKEIKKSQFNDGSFFMWENDERSNSIWLSSYILQWLIEARTVIDIDENIIKNGLMYLTNETVYVNDKTSKGFYRNLAHGVAKEYLSSLVALTLLKYKNLEDNQVTVLKIILQNISQVKKYDIGRVIAAYALAYGNKSDEARGIINSKKFVRNYLNTATWDASLKSQTVFIEVAALETLTFMKLGDLENAAKSAQWLLEHRNQDGNFQSTYESVLALDAICEFMLAERSLNSANIDLNVKEGGALLSRFKSNDPLQTIYKEIKTGGTSNHRELAVEARGSGAGYFTFHYSYFTKKSQPENYHLKMDANYADNKLNIRLKDKDGNRRLAAVEISMPSGFSYKSHRPDAHIRSLNSDHQLLTIIAEFTQKEEIIDLNINLEKSEGIKKSDGFAIKTYEFYAPKIQVEKFVLIGEEENCHGEKIPEELSCGINKSDLEGSKIIMIDTSEGKCVGFFIEEYKAIASSDCVNNLDVYKLRVYEYESGEWSLMDTIDSSNIVKLQIDNFYFLSLRSEFDFKLTTSNSTNIDVRKCSTIGINKNKNIHTECIPDGFTSLLNDKTKIKVSKNFPDIHQHLLLCMNGEKAKIVGIKNYKKANEFETILLPNDDEF